MKCSIHLDSLIAGFIFYSLTYFRSTHFLKLVFFPPQIINHSEGFCGYSSSCFSLKDPNAQLYFSIFPIYPYIYIYIPIFIGFVFSSCAPMLSCFCFVFLFFYFLCFTLFRKGSQAPVFVWWWDLFYVSPHFSMLLFFFFLDLLVDVLVIFFFLSHWICFCSIRHQSFPLVLYIHI